MKSLIVFLVSFVLLFGSFVSPASSRPRPRRPRGRAVKAIKNPASIKNRKAKAKELKLVIAELERKIKISTAEKEIARVKGKLKRIRAALRELAIDEAPARPRPGMPKPQPLRPRSKARRMHSPQFGLSAGYLAGIMGAVGEIRYHNPFEMLSTSLRLGAGYAQGDDSAGTARRHALIIVDGIYRLNPPQAKGMRNYFGGGINYLAYTTGQTSGTLGGQVFYGVEANAGEGQIYGEVGYGVIRTGFSPNQTGMNVQVGYKI